MKKVLSLTVAVLLGLSLYAQGGTHYYVEKFTNSEYLPTGWQTYGWVADWWNDEGNVVWSYGGSPEDGDENRARINHELITTTFKLSLADTIGYLHLNLATRCFDTAGLFDDNGRSISGAYIYGKRDTATYYSRLGDLLIVESYNDPTEVLISLGDIRNELGLVEEEADFIFAVVHTASVGDESVLFLRDFWLGVPKWTASFGHNRYEGTGVMDDIVTEAFTGHIVVPECTFVREGYEFACWYVRDAAGYPNYAFPGDDAYLDDNETFMACWKKRQVFTFHGNDENVQGEQEEFEVYDWNDVPWFDYMPESGYTLEGHVFMGWNTEADGTGKTYVPGDTVVCHGDREFYAIWGEGEIAYRVQYDGNNGFVLMSNSIVLPGTQYTIPEGYYDEYYAIDSTTYQLAVFRGWNTESNGTGDSYKAGDRITITTNITLYAQWVDLYIVDYDANGGRGTMKSDTVAADEHYNLSANGFTREGFHFVGWAVRPNESASNATRAGAEITVPADLTLYAVWAENGTEGINKVNPINVSLYPNPAIDVVKVEGVQSARLEVMDLSGRMVRSAEAANSINLNGLNSGVYMLRVSTAEGSAVRRIVKK